MRRHGFVGAASIAVVAATLLAPSAHAAGYRANATFGVAPTVSDFAAVALSGSPQLTGAAIDPFTVDEQTTGDWHVELTVPDFAGQHTGTTIPATDVTTEAPAVTDGNGDPVPTITASAVGFGDLSVARNNQIDWVSASSTPIGTYQISPGPLELYVAPDVLADSYSTTVDLAVIAGP